MTINFKYGTYTGVVIDTSTNQWQPVDTICCQLYLPDNHFIFQDLCQECKNNNNHPFLPKCLETCQIYNTPFWIDKKCPVLIGNRIGDRRGKSIFGWNYFGKYDDLSDLKNIHQEFIGVIEWLENPATRDNFYFS